MRFLFKVLLIISVVFPVIFRIQRIACSLPIEIEGSAVGGTKQRAPMKLLIGIQNENLEVVQLANLLKNNLQKSGQFNVDIKIEDTPKIKSDVKNLFSSGYPLIIFLKNLNGGYEWRLYDSSEAEMVKGKKTQNIGKSLKAYADRLSDELWLLLTKQPGSFATKVAYVKKILGNRKQESVICLANIDGSNEKTIVKKPGLYLGLRWHNDILFPCIFCSEITKYNVRLITANLKNQQRIVFNFNGTCVGISLAPDNSKAVYCKSGDIWQCYYDPKQKKSIHNVLIKNDGKNVSPTLLSNGDIIFCSDSKKVKAGLIARGPQIGRYNASTKNVELLTKEGYNVGPSYSSTNQKVAYSRQINGVMQLFVYHIQTKQNQQITFDLGNKIDCSWAPCGNWLAFCYQKDKISKIAIMHLGTRKRIYITPENHYCTSPSWSPLGVS